MNYEINFIPLSEVMSSLTDHPMLQHVNFEQCVRYALEFINKVGFPSIYQNKTCKIDIHEYRGKLPCDCVCVRNVSLNGQRMKRSTSDFGVGNSHNNEYKIQGMVIFTSVEECQIDVAYEAIPVDEKGFPMIPDIPLFVNALELYIKKKVFTIKFDMQEIPQQVLFQAQQDYSWAVAQLRSELTIPNVDEMINITYMLNQWIPSRHEFRDGFSHLGDHMDLPNRRRI